MKLKQAVQILEAHNKWRRGEDGEDCWPMSEPVQLGVAIDTIVAYHLELERQEFIGNYIQKKMETHELPYSGAYFNLLAKVTEDAEKKWKIKLKLKK